MAQPQPQKVQASRRCCDFKFNPKEIDGPPPSVFNRDEFYFNNFTHASNTEKDFQTFAEGRHVKHGKHGKKYFTLHCDDENCTF
jgi:hypothetical protein